MDTEKGFQADTSFQSQSDRASCHTCRGTQKKQFIIKSIFGLVLLGLLVLNSYQSIHALPSKLSSLQLEQHDAIPTEAQGHHDLSLTVEAPQIIGDDGAPWHFTAFTKNGCGGQATNNEGNGTSIACQPFNKKYRATAVPILDKSLKICFYPAKDCEGQSTEITDQVDCQNIQPSRSYRVLSNTTSCQLALM